MWRLVLASFLTISMRAVAQAPSRVSLTAFSENQVSVEIFLVRDALGAATLEGTFTPTHRSYHLYSADLPRDGADGLGRPTLIEIIGAGPVQPNGPMRANRRPIERRSKVLGITLPTYPNGPVTLTQPLTGWSSDSTLTVEVSVTYMACSDRVCFPPVVDRRVRVTLPTS